MNFRFLTPAFAEIREAAEFYENRVSGLGADFLDEVDAAIERILSFPEAWGKNTAAAISGDSPTR